MRKAALLLMSLDPASAAELLKEARPEVATRLVAELAWLNAAGASAEAPQQAQEFLGLLRKSVGDGSRKLLKQMLEGAMGREKSRDVLARLDDLATQQDPFLPIRDLPAADLAGALAGEPAQVVSLVLSELPSKKSGELVGLIDEKVRVESLRGVAAGEEPAPEVRKRVADLILSRLKSPATQQRGRRQAQVRKVAVLLRGLAGELRNALLEAISAADAPSATAIRQAMITWDDVVAISERSLQDFLRGAESRKLALALVGADPAIDKKLRSNMSERAATMLEEEISLLSAPKPAEINAARENLLEDLREMAANNMLSFEEA